MQNWKEMVSRALPAFDGRLGIDHVSYMANGQVHRDLPYVATNPAVVKQKVALYKSAGFDVIRCTWQGPWSSSSHQDSILTAAECARQGMQFALLLDPGGMQKWNGAGQGAAVITANIQAALSDATTQSDLIKISSYVPEMLIFDFNTGGNLATLAKSFPTLKFLAQGSGFSWPSINATLTDSVQRNAASVANLQKQNATSGMLAPGICPHFNDAGQPLPVGVATQTAFDAAGGKRDYSSSVWGGPARILGSFGGLFLQQQLAVTPATAPFIFVVTADDYDEGTAIEPQLNEQAGIVWAT